MRDWAARALKYPGRVIFLAVFLGGLPSLGAGFFMDDYGHYRSAQEAGWGLKSLASAYTIDVRDVHDGWIPEEMSHFRFSYFRPFSLLYFKVNIALWKDWKPGFHLMSLFVHFLAACMVFALGCKLLPERKHALVAALLFAWFPQNVPTVPWISTSGELLTSFLCMLAVWSYLEFRRRGRKSFFPLALFGFLLALLVKEYAVVLPLVVLLADVLLVSEPQEGRVARMGSLLWSLPFFLLLGGYLVLRGVALGEQALPPSTRYFCPPLEPGCIAFALNKVLYGILMVFFFFPAMEAPFSFLVRNGVLTLLGAGLIFALAALVQHRIGWDRKGLFALGWVVLFLVPTAPFAPAPWQIYVPSAGGCILIVWCFSKGFVRRPVSSALERARWKKVLPSLALGLFFLVYLVFGFTVSWFNQKQMRIADSVSRELLRVPEARRLFFLDVKALRYNYIQELRMRQGHRPIEVHILSMLHLGASPSRIEQIDDHRFLAEAQGRAYFLELGWGGRRGAEIEIVPGRTERVGDYRIRVGEVGLLPKDSDPGVVQYVYDFEKPLRDPENLFFQVIRDRVERIEFR